MQIGGLHSKMTTLGRVSVRLSGVVRGSADGQDASAINAPKIGDARAELDRVARVTGADKVMGVVSDYRRTALAGGPKTQWRVEVQAWGTAMAAAEPRPSERKEDEQDSLRKAEAERQADRADAVKEQREGEGRFDPALGQASAAPPAPTSQAEALPAANAAAPSWSPETATPPPSCGSGSVTGPPADH